MPGTVAGCLLEKSVAPQEGGVFVDTTPPRGLSYADSVNQRRP
jgi:hypothetical protein